MFRRFLALWLGLLASGCAGASGAVEGRLSSIVAFDRQGSDIRKFLAAPKRSVVEAYVRFPEELAEDVIFGIDQEFLEGTARPRRQKGGDWMGLTGVQRGGALWIAVGTDATAKGKPSTSRTWKVLSLGQSLRPNTWYRIRNVVDFENGRFVSFAIDGPGISKRVDLGAYRLDYPGYAPFDGRAMTYYVWCMRGRSMARDANAPAIVFFDDVQAGILEGSNEAQFKVTFRDDFEGLSGAFPKQPVTFSGGAVSSSIALANYAEKKWYLEADQARLRPVAVPFARSGNTAVACDATLQDIDYQQWLNKAR